MKKLTFILFLLCTVPVCFAQSSAVVRDYIAMYKDVAIEEMHRTGVPAAITLAQGIHETSAGQSDLVRKSNNHFGIKCKSDWTGESVTHDDDARGECFRKYTDPMDSYRDHSDFLKNRSHYAFLFRLDPTDYEAWAYGLKKAGYATNPKYPQILIKLIRDYDLQDYTMLALDTKKESDVVLVKNSGTLRSESAADAKEAAPQYPGSVFQINDTRVQFVAKGTSFLKIAEEADLPLPRLFEYNDMNPADLAPRDMLVFLQRKRRKGGSEFHVVAPGESVQEISQKEGIRLESLLAYNFLREGLQPVVGEKLYLQYEAPAAPKLLTDSKDRPEPEAAAGTVEVLTHRVQPKETLYAIAKKYDVSKEDLLKWNHLSSSELKIGQQLRIQKRSNGTN